MKDGNFLIVGGYGKVGRTIAILLAREFPQRVVVGGRRFDKANQLSVELDRKVLPLELDVSSEMIAESFLDDISVVIMCIDQQDTRFVEKCIRRGIHYIDITASYQFLAKLETLGGAAEKSGSTVVLSVGIAPGLTNVLASLAKSRSLSASHIDLFVMLGLGDEHGVAAQRWTFQNLYTTFRIRDHRGFRQVKSFHENKTAYFPDELGLKRAYRFNFSDQHVIPNTLLIDSASTWFCLDSPFMTELLALGAKSGVLKVLRDQTIQNVVISLLRLISFGSDAFALKAEAYLSPEKTFPIFECSLVGRGAGYITGVVAAKVASLIYKSPVLPGVFHLEQIVDPVTFVNEMEQEGLKYYESIMLDKKT